MVIIRAKQLAMSVIVNCRISPYDRKSGRVEKILGTTILGSIAVHVFICWIFLFLLPALPWGTTPAPPSKTLTVMLIPDTPPAASVNPDQPDVIDNSISNVSTIQPFTPNQAVTVAAPTDEFFAPEAKDFEKLIGLQKKETEPIKIQVPELTKAPVQQKRDLDAEIAAVMQALEDKAAAAGGMTEGESIHPEKMRYYNHIRNIVSSNWVPPSRTSSATTADLQIKIDPNGTISAIQVRQASGNHEFDMSVKRAIIKSSPFPALPPIFGGVADSPTLRFNDKELRSGLASVAGASD